MKIIPTRFDIRYVTHLSFLSIVDHNFVGILISYNIGVKLRARSLVTLPDSMSQKFLRLGFQTWSDKRILAELSLLILISRRLVEGNATMATMRNGKRGHTTQSVYESYGAYILEILGVWLSYAHFLFVAMVQKKKNPTLITTLVRSITIQSYTRTIVLRRLTGHSREVECPYDMAIE